MCIKGAARMPWRTPVCRASLEPVSKQNGTEPPKGSVMKTHKVEDIALSAGPQWAPSPGWAGCVVQVGGVVTMSDWRTAL
ncbi:hypothetical protein GCM10020000_76070 [Streptomyces olivoverticillatus]